MMCLLWIKAFLNGINGMGNIFNIDFREFLQALRKAKVAYILVGGYSVILHGYNRTTGDLDVWVNCTSANYARLMQAFADFGLPSIAENIFFDTANYDVFSFGVPPISIDVITVLKGLDFNTAFAQANEINVEGLMINLIHLNDLISSKKAVGRHKDLDDIENLQK